VVFGKRPPSGTWQVNSCGGGGQVTEGLAEKKKGSFRAGECDHGNRESGKLQLGEVDGHRGSLEGVIRGKLVI